MKLVNPRNLAQRSFGLMTSVLSYVQKSKLGIAPSPLLLVIRRANQLAEHILDQPSPIATPAQRRTLRALSAQLRAMTARVIVTADARDPQSVEGELTELIRRTFAIVERACAEPPAIEPARGNVIDVSAIESPGSGNTRFN